LPATSLERRQSTLLTLAVPNAVNAHSNILLDGLLPKLTQQSDISKQDCRLLSSSLKKRLNAAEVAAITPAVKEKDVSLVSLMPSGDTDSVFTDQIAELAVYLDLDVAFIAEETSRNRL
jgi:hypothetical protein